MNNYDEVAELYDIYVDVDFDVDYFVGEALKVVGPVLELACGTGRLSLPLVRAGVDLTCVDISAKMLDVLEGKLLDNKLSANVIQADICELPLDQQFDLVIFPFHSFAEIVGRNQHLEVLNTVYSGLNAGQKFICTLLNPTVHRKSIDGTKQIVGRHQLGDRTLTVSGISVGGDPVVSREQYYEIHDNRGALVSKKTMKMTYELVEPTEFLQIAESVGFSSLNRYGDYQRSVFDLDKSPVIVWELVR